MAGRHAVPTTNHKSPDTLLPVKKIIHQTIRPGDGLTDEVCDAVIVAVRAVTPAMFKAQEPWALMGSTASVLQGLDGYSPPDIDIVTTTVGAYIMSGAVAGWGATIRPVSFGATAPYSGHFGVFEVRGVKVDIMGDLLMRVDDGEINTLDHFSRWSDKVRILHFEGLHIPVVPLEWQLLANVLLDRPERYERIAAHLAASGYDQAYMDLLLSDPACGARTIKRARELLNHGA